MIIFPKGEGHLAWQATTEEHMDFNHKGPLPFANPSKTNSLVLQKL